MSEVLSYQEAKEIYEEILLNRQQVGGAADDLYDDLYQKAARYANIRALWRNYTRAEKLDKDSGRTSAHDAFISALNIVARFQKEAGAAWRKRLGDDRKQLGDFACYLALFAALQER